MGLIKSQKEDFRQTPQFWAHASEPLMALSRLGSNCGSSKVEGECCGLFVRARCWVLSC
jgi:hypothetical protein